MKKSFHTVTSEADWARVIPLIWETAAGRTVWLLNGELGSGKTTLVKYLVEFLGGNIPVSSPTFSLVNTYEWTSGGKTFLLHHLDLYRLDSIDEAINIGLEELLDQDALFVIEWPEISRPILPEDCFELEISHLGSNRKVLVL